MSPSPTAPVLPEPPHTEAPRERHLRFRPDIEGLRAVAILLVVLFHAGWHRASSGYLGVDVFFVLSGFLISGLLLDEVEATGTVSLTGFWARRARRLLPAAAVVTLVVLVANYFVLGAIDQLNFARTARSFALYASNILFAVRSTDYFGDAAVRDPLLHTWSLSVEEQFYLIYAPAFWVLALLVRRRNSATVVPWVRVGVVVASIFSLGACVLIVRRYPVIAFYSLPVRAWEFGLGALALVASRPVAQAPRFARESLALAGLVAILGSAAVIPSVGTPPLGLLTLVPTLGTMMLLLSGAGGGITVTGRVLSLGPVRYLGRLSYSWYLWHWPMLVYLRELVPEPALSLSFGVAFLALVPAALTYYLVECPVRFSPQLRLRPGVAVTAALLLAALTWGAGTAGVKIANRVLGDPRFQEIVAARQLPQVYSDGCQVALLVTESPPCAYGPGANDTTVTLFGDSHAAQWFPALDSVVALRGWRLVNLTKRGCPSVNVHVPNIRLGRAYLECDRWRTDAIDRILASRPTIVLVSNDRSYNILLENAQPHTDSNEAARQAWQAGLVQTLSALRPSGARLVVLEDTPQPQLDVPRCLMRHFRSPAECPDPLRTVALDSVVLGSERTAVGQVPGAVLVSLNQFICGPVRCPLADHGVIRYKDDNHLSVRFAASLAPQLSLLLSQVLASERAVDRP